MAFGAKKIFPIDTKPGTAVGISLPFSAPAVFFSTYTTKEAIKNNLINYFLTNPTEVYLVPNFGAGLRAFIFEQIAEGNLEGLKSQIQFQLKTYFPSIIVASLDITENIDNNEINVILTYNIADTGINDQLQISFQ